MKILIVDDFEEILKLLRTFLTKRGFSTVTAKNGREGVELAKRELPDLILMDIIMPLLNGEDAMKALKAEPATAHIPILAVTGCSVDSDRERFLLEAGFDGLIEKPINLNLLLNIVQWYAIRQPL